MATTPDLICLVDTETFRPVTTDAMKYGKRVMAVGMKCFHLWRTEKGLELAGPRYFGLDTDYIPLAEKIRAVAEKVYHADGVDFLPAAAKELEKLEALGFGSLPVCIAKTQYSFSDNPALLGRPSGFRITVKSIRLSAGAGFVVVLTGDIMTMPGLPRVPAAESIDVDENGRISGLF